LIFDKKRPGSPVVEAYLVTSEVNRFDPHLKHLKEFKSLKRLILPHRMTDAGWKEVREVKSLEWLRASSGLENLEQARDLASLHNLRELGLGAGDDVLLRELLGMQNLTALTFDGHATRNAESGALAGFKRLRRLSLPGAGFVDPKRAGFSELTALEELSVGSAINDAGLRDLAKLRSLRVLRIGRPAFTDAGLAELKTLAGLRRLVLPNAKVTPAAVEGLKKALPGLVVKLNEDERDVLEDYERIKGKVKVLDANTLVFEDGNRVRLHIRTPKAGEGGAKEAAEFLAKLIGDRPVDCFMVNNEYRFWGYVGDVNLQHAMIINGWALQNHSSTGPAATIAREKKRGIWADK
jgi:hypothetical protein